jgi:hypothetical protein
MASHSSGESSIVKTVELEPTVCFTGPFRFFDLLPEIRGLVFDEVWSKLPSLWQATLPQQLSPLLDVWAMYRKREAVCHGSNRLPLWLCVSRAFLREGMDQFWRNIDWRAMIPGSFFTTRFFLGSSEMHYDMDKKMAYQLRSIPNNGAQPTWDPISHYSHTVIGVRKLSLLQWTMLRKFEKSLRMANGRKQLSVIFGVDLLYTYRVTRVDLSGLEHINFELDDLVVDVVCKPSSRANISVDEIRTLIQDEVVRLGTVMVGQGSILNFSSKPHALIPAEHWTFKVSKMEP